MSASMDPAVPWAPLPSFEDALARAQAYFPEGDSMVVDPTSLLPNPLQGLWIASYVSALTGEHLQGGGLVIPSEGEVYPISSAGYPDELVGVQFPEEDEADLEPDPTDDEVEEIVAQMVGQTEIEGILAYFGEGKVE